MFLSKMPEPSWMSGPDYQFEERESCRECGADLPEQPDRTENVDILDYCDGELRLGDEMTECWDSKAHEPHKFVAGTTVSLIWKCGDHEHRRYDW